MRSVAPVQTVRIYLYMRPMHRLTLAQKIHRENAPHNFQGKEIYYYPIDMSANNLYTHGLFKTYSIL